MINGLRDINCANCGQIVELSRMFKQAYCRACHAEHSRNNRRKHSELPPVAKKKANARKKAAMRTKRGLLEKQPCVKCGEAKAERHHEDYDKPYDVIWMCRPCHLEHHKNQQNDGRN